MSKCKIFIPEKGIRYSCYEFKVICEDLKSEFRKNNRTDKIIESGRVDERYNEYCECIDSFIAQCTCEDDLKCDKCSEKDHEGFFCRCEDRNIELAKKFRSLGLSPWKKR